MGPRLHNGPGINPLQRDKRETPKWIPEPSQSKPNVPQTNGGQRHQQIRATTQAAVMLCVVGTNGRLCVYIYICIYTDSIIYIYIYIYIYLYIYIHIRILMHL